MNNWYEINAKKNEAEIFIYESIGDAAVTGVSARDFIKDLGLINAPEIALHINSPGGNVFDGNAIYNVLKRHKSRITVKIDGIAASIASVVAMAGDVVEMPENAMMMIHDPSGVAIGTAEDMRQLAVALDKIKGGLVSAYRSKSGLDDVEIEKMMSDETWFTAQDALRKGFCDEITGAVRIAACVGDLRIIDQCKYIPKHVTDLLIGRTQEKGQNTMHQLNQFPKEGDRTFNLFEEVVCYYSNEGLSYGRAIRAAVEKHPDLHERYLERLRAGQACELTR